MDQCVQGEGLVQVNVQIKQPQKRINIVDVLKPTEDYTELRENNSKIEKKNFFVAQIICKKNYN